MFPKAPKVEVYAPTTLVAGQEVSVEIRVIAEERLKVEYIDAHITGHQGWRVGSGKNAVTMRHEYPTLTARLRGEGQLVEAVSQYRTNFRLPHDMPPSHSMTPAWAWLELFVRVAIPWWPDGKYKFTLPVRIAAPPAIERTPYAIRSSASANDPRLELSLASTQLIAGESVVGSLAVFHLDDRKPREIDLSLVPSFKLAKGRRIRERRGQSLGITVTIPPGAAGTSVPFRFRLPADITPTFSTLTHELAWWLVAKTGSFFSTKIELDVPLVIYDAAAAARSERLSVAPRLSDERITGAFAQFASELGWQQTADPEDPEQLVYEREVGDATLRLGYSYRGEAGSFLVASVAYPSLGLALDVTPSSRVRELLSKDVEVDIAEWDRTHHVSARSAVQTLSFLRSTVPALAKAATWLGPLRRWSDEEIVFERPVSTVDVRDLRRGGDYLEMIAGTLAAASILSPPELTVDLAEYKQLAQRLQGRLCVGDLTIEGTLDQRPVMVALEFDGERPARLFARVGDPAAAVEQGELTDAERAELPADFVDLQLVDGVASAGIVLDGRLAPARVKELVTALRALLARRDPNRGPYR